MLNREMISVKSNQIVGDLNINDQDFKIIYGDCFKYLPNSSEMFDLIFVDPPYLLSNNGITCQSGKMVNVNKGKWDESKGFEKDLEFTKNWIQFCSNVLKPNGSIWITGTSHIIYKISFR